MGRTVAAAPGPARSARPAQAIYMTVWLSTGKDLSTILVRVGRPGAAAERGPHDDHAGLDHVRASRHAVDVGAPGHGPDPTVLPGDVRRDQRVGRATAARHHHRRHAHRRSVPVGRHRSRHRAHHRRGACLPRHARRRAPLPGRLPAGGHREADVVQHPPVRVPSRRDARGSLRRPARGRPRGAAGVAVGPGLHPGARHHAPQRPARGDHRAGCRLRRVAVLPVVLRRAVGRAAVGMADRRPPPQPQLRRHRRPVRVHPQLHGFRAVQGPPAARSPASR